METLLYLILAWAGANLSFGRIPGVNVNSNVPALAQLGASISHDYTVALVQGQMTVTMDGTQVFSGSVTVPPVAYLYCPVHRWIVRTDRHQQSRGQCLGIAKPNRIFATGRLDWLSFPLSRFKQILQNSDREHPRLRQGLELDSRVCPGDMRLDSSLKSTM